MPDESRNTILSRRRFLQAATAVAFGATASVITEIPGFAYAPCGEVYCSQVGWYCECQECCCPLCYWWILWNCYDVYNGQYCYEEWTNTGDYC